MIFTTERYPNINNLTTLKKLVDALVEEPAEVEWALSLQIIARALQVLLTRTYGP